MVLFAHSPSAQMPLTLGIDAVECLIPSEPSLLNKHAVSGIYVYALCYRDTDEDGSFIEMPQAVLDTVLILKFDTLGRKIIHKKKLGNGEWLIIRNITIQNRVGIDSNDEQYIFDAYNNLIEKRTDKSVQKICFDSLHRMTKVVDYWLLEQPDSVVTIIRYDEKGRILEKYKRPSETFTSNTGIDCFTGLAYTEKYIYNDGENVTVVSDGTTMWKETQLAGRAQLRFDTN